MNVHNEDEDSGMLLADGLEDALIGYAHPWQAGQLPVAIYSTQRVLGILMARDGMDYEGAREFFEFNIAGGYMGTQTPIFVDLAITPELLKAGTEALIQWATRSPKSIKTNPEGAVAAIFTAWGGEPE